MQLIFGFLALLISIYSLLIFIRIILSWFRSGISSKPVNFLYRITDPYLNWWRNNLKLQFGMMDFSPLAGIVALSVIQTILHALSRFNIITIGGILAILLGSIWSVTAFLLNFIIIIFILRLIAYITNRDIYSSFWKVIDTISQPILYRINRIIFKDRIVNFVKGLIVSAILIIALRIGGSVLIPIFARLLAGLPV